MGLGVSTIDRAAAVEIQPSGPCLGSHQPRRNALIYLLGGYLYPCTMSAYAQSS